MEQRAGLAGSGNVCSSGLALPQACLGKVTLTVYVGGHFCHSHWVQALLPLSSPFLSWQPVQHHWCGTSHQHSHKRGISLHLPHAWHHLPAQDREGLGPTLPSDPPLLSRDENTSSLRHIPKEPPSPALSSVMAPAGRLRQHNSRSVGTARRLRHKGSEKTRGVPPISSKCKGLFRVPATTSSSSWTTQSENQFLRRK